MKTAKVKLVTIVADFAAEERLITTLTALGASGYTLTRADGGGLHGVRRRGVVHAGNVRIETLVPADLAYKILEHIVREYHELDLIAYAHDVEAVPPEHFS